MGTDDEMVAWLTGALDEIERVAQRASLRDSEWHADEGWSESWGRPARDHEVVAGGKPIVREDVEYSYHGAVAHIALHDPRAALARVQAERAIVDTWGQARGWDGGRDGEVIRATLETVLEHLACGHRHDVPGWREEWAPEPVEADV